MKRYLTRLMIAGLLSFPLLAHAEDYVIDVKGGHAFINAKFLHLGMSVIPASFTGFSGEFSYDPDRLDQASVSIDIDVGSIDSHHAERDRHMRGKRFLYTDAFPKASFVSTSVEPLADGRFTIHGDLKLIGTTRRIAIDAETIGEGKDPWGGYRAGFKGFVTLDMREFGVKTFKPLHTVRMELFIEGKRKRR